MNAIISSTSIKSEAKTLMLRDLMFRGRECSIPLFCFRSAFTQALTCLSRFGDNLSIQGNGEDGTVRFREVLSIR